MINQTLKASERKVFGRKVKNLRKEGRLPANIYGKKVKSTAVEVDISEFEKVFKEVGETGLVEIRIKSKKRPVLIHNVQKDPVTDNYLHADFFQVDLKQKVKAQVPVELENVSPAEKQGIGTVVQYIDEIEVLALPTDLPESFKLDLTALAEVDQVIAIKDLKVDKEKVEIQGAESQIIVKVEPPRKEEEEAPTVEAEEEEGEAVKEKEGEIEEKQVGKEGETKEEQDGGPEGVRPSSAEATAEGKRRRKGVRSS